MMAKKHNTEGLNTRIKLVKGRRSKQNHERLSKKMNADLEDQIDIVPELDVDFQKPSKKGRTKEPVKRPTKEFVQYSHTKLKMRCSPSEFMSSIQKFTEAQKSEVKNMGFAAILTMNIDSIATGLGYWLLMNYDVETNTVNVGNHKIKITPSKVQEVFGIPMGKIQVLEKNKPRKGAHSTIDEFKNQFDTSRINVGKILLLIEQLQDGGRLFKLNFLVVWNTVFGEITKSTTVNQRFLLGIENESEIPEMDWCSYIIDCLKRTKISWRGYNDQYNGPIALLAVLYTHEYYKRHKPQYPIKTPAISYITSESLDDMETFLFNNGPLTDDEVEEENMQLTKWQKAPRFKDLPPPTVETSNMISAILQIPEVERTFRFEAPPSVTVSHASGSNMSALPKSSSNFSLDEIDSMISKKEEPATDIPKRQVPVSKPKITSAKKRKNVEPSGLSSYEGLNFIETHSKLHGLIIQGHEQMIKAYETSSKEAQEAKEMLQDLQKISASKDKVMQRDAQELAQIKKELEMVKAQHVKEMTELCDRVKRSAATAVCQARIKMALQAMDESFDRSSWDVEGWRQRLEELGGKMVQYPEQDMAEGSGAADKAETKGKEVEQAEPDVEAMQSGEDDKDKA